MVWLALTKGTIPYRMFWRRFCWGVLQPSMLLCWTFFCGRRLLNSVEIWLITPEMLTLSVGYCEDGCLSAVSGEVKSAHYQRDLQSSCSKEYGLNIKHRAERQERGRGVKDVWRQARWLKALMLKYGCASCHDGRSKCNSHWIICSD